MTFEEFKTNFLSWTENEIETKKDDGFPVCPYAKHARINNKIEFIDAREATMEQLRSFDKEQYEIGIAWIEGQDINSIEQMLEYLNEANPDLLYFVSTTESGHFVKNFTNCVFIQLRSDIEMRREQLHETDYYASWPEQYYAMITNT